MTTTVAPVAMPTLDQIPESGLDDAYAVDVIGGLPIAAAAAHVAPDDLASWLTTGTVPHHVRRLLQQAAQPQTGWTATSC